MKVLVSACLVGRPCKYSGGDNKSQEVLDFLRGHEVFLACPEVLGGLPIPRPPSEIQGERVMTIGGEDVTQNFLQGAQKALDLAQREGVDLLILKSRSPSCGPREVYDGTFSGRLVPGRGVFAGLAEEAGFKLISEEDL